MSDRELGTRVPCGPQILRQGPVCAASCVYVCVVYGVCAHP